LGQESVIHFGHLTIDDGLSDNTVYAVVQDGVGFLWFGTQNGLNRYDGYTVTVFRHDPYNPNSISNDNAGNLFVDRAGVLWIGTWGGGLDRYDPKSGQFTNYRNDPANPASLSHNRVQTIYQDRAGLIWVGTSGGGLNRLDPSSGQVKVYRHQPDNPASLSNDRIWRLAEDGQGQLWIATSEGLSRFDPASETFTTYHTDPANPASLRDNLIRVVYTDRAGTLWVGTEKGLHRYRPASDDFEVYQNKPADPYSLNDDIINAVLEDSAGRFWVGTRSGGLNLLNRATGRFTHLRNNPLDPNSLSYDDIRWIHEDKAGVIWLGTRGGGVNKLVPTSGRFRHFGSTPNNPNSLSSNDVRAIYQDAANLLWIGLKGGGLNQYDPASGQFTVYMPEADNPNSLSHPDVYAIHQDRSGFFWLGTAGGGLNRFDPHTGQFSHYQNDPNDPATLSSNDVNTVFEDQSGSLWIGTKGGGLNRFDSASGQFTVYRHNPNDPASLSNDDVYALHQDKSGSLWVGTYGGGLNRFNSATGQFSHYPYEPENPSSLSDNNIYAIHEDRNGSFWLATANGGLNRFDPATGQATRFTQQEGLVSDVIYSIQEDKDGHLWLSTNKGLTHFDSASGAVINYDASDGLERVIYHEGASFKGRDGALYFGGINGLTKFSPDNLPQNSYVPPVVLTRFSLFNQPVQLGQPIDQVSQLHLNYGDDVLSFSFAALDYTAPAKNRYTYMLEGFDRDWNRVNGPPFVTYTNLDPGQYTLRIQGSNNAGVWNEAGLAVAISVTPPFWETWWFRTLGALGTLALGLSVYRLRVQAIESQRQRLQVQVTERTAALTQANQELHQLTDRLQSELALAQKIQRSLLPPPRPDWAGPEVICYSRPALEVGGDFYSYYSFNSDGAEPPRFGVVVGDVSGKGMPAALLMAVSLGSLQSMVGQDPAPAELLSRLDDTLRPYTHTTNQNCAVCYAELAGCQLSVINAGSIAPLVKRANGSVFWIDATGLPLGVAVERPRHFRVASLTLTPGDLIILVSDGIIEAMNEQKALFGFDRMEQTVAAGPTGSAAAMLDHLRMAIEHFTNGHEPHDDLTILAIQV
jgi:ligand-binding sensor domain-containing protein/serine phosphatase RsbU (regulator of sigma subunit)